MICKIIYAENAISQLKKLSIATRKQILEKLYFYSQQSNPMFYAKKLSNSDFGEFRFRIGKYRAIFDMDKQGNITVLFILLVKHRKDIYK